MEKEKYYTPKIEEFCVGFEYEEFETNYIYDIKLTGNIVNDKIEANVLSEPKSEKKWNKKIYTGEDFIWPINSEEYKLHFIKSDLRVKYLDREDIESLGWTKRDEPYAPSSTYLPKSSVLESYYKNKTELYITKDVDFIPPKHLMIYQLSALRGYGDEEHRSVFKGTVKNKTELRKLMEMLGIK